MEYLTVLLMSLTPVSELRGALIYARAAGLPFWPAFIVAVCGNLLLIPVVILFCRCIIKLFLHIQWVSRAWDRLQSYAHRKAENVVRYQMLGLFLLVAIPLPGTGAYTGALVASVMDLRLKNAMPSIALGVVVAGIVTALFTYGLTALFI